MSVLARVLGKFLSDQEHDFLVGWLLNKHYLHAFKQNGYMKNDFVLRNKKNYFVCVLEKSCDLWIMFGNILFDQLNDFGS